MTSKGYHHSDEWKREASERMQGERNPNWLGISKICEECGKEFFVKTRRKDTARFCSWACRKKGLSVVKICVQCGKEFQVEKSRENTARFCSFSCKGIWQSKNLIGKAHPSYGKPISEETRKKLIESHKGIHPSEETLKKRCMSLKKSWEGAEERRKILREKFTGERNRFWEGKGTVTKICEVCGKEFTVEKYREDTAKVCSHKCGSKLKEVEPIKIKCKYCGKEFSKIPSQVKFFDPKYCSKECFWLGSLSAERYDDYCDLFDSVKPRAIAFYKDMYGDICPLCLEYLISGVGSVHHVYGQKRSCCEVIGDKNYTNLNLKNHPPNFEIIGSPDKFIVLCKSCHSKIWSRRFEKRAEWTRHIEKLINEVQGGKSFYTMEEFYGDNADKERERINKKILARQKKKMKMKSGNVPE